jgi:large subunit ribosomal protein L25
MEEEVIKIEAKIRKEVGKRSLLKKIRNSGFIPAILYGKNIENIPVMVERKEFEKKYPQIKNKPFLLKIPESNKEFKVIIQEIQRDPISDKIIHLDFYKQ